MALCALCQITHENTSMGVVVAQPADACKPLENNVRGKAVLVRRGACPFVQKAEQVRCAVSAERLALEVGYACGDVSL